MIGDLTELQQERREKILQASLTQFSTIGFYKTELEHIAREAGVGKGTIYRYFRNKHDLYLKTVEYEIDKFFRFLVEQLASAKTLSEYFSIWIRRFLTYFTAERHSFRLFFLSSAGVVEDVIKIVESMQKKYYPVLAGPIQRAIDGHALSSVEPGIIIGALDGMLMFLLFSQSRQQGGSIEDIYQSVWTLVSQGWIREEFAL